MDEPTRDVTEFHMLRTAEIPPPPPDIEIIADYGDVTIQNAGRPIAGGRHIHVRGSAVAVKKWLSPFRGVWVGEGIAQLQQFRVIHIK